MILIRPRRQRRPRVGGQRPSAKRRYLARVDLFQPLESLLGRGHQLGIGAVRHIHESDVIVFAVHPSRNRLIDAGEISRAQELRQRRRLFDKITIRDAALLLVFHLHQACAQPVLWNPEVELAQDHRPPGKFVGGRDLLSRLVLIDVQAVNVEDMGCPGDVVRRIPPETNPQVQVIGVVLLECRTHHVQVLLKRRNHELPPAFRRIPLGQKPLHLCLHRIGRSGQHHVHHLRFAARPWRFIPDEVPDQPRIVLVRRQLRPGALLQKIRKFLRVHIGHPQV